METTTTAPAKPLLRNRDYLLLWSGQAVSRFGSAFSGIALPFLILALTGSPQQTGVAFALGAVPYLVFSLPAGALIDRWNRKRVMIICDVGRALALGSIPLALWLGRLTVLQINIALLAEGTFFVFFNIAEISCLPRVVAKSQLTTAIGYNQAVDFLGGVVGPPLGGALFGLSQLLPFVIDAVSYMATVASLMLIRTRFQLERVAKTGTQHLWRDIGEGMRWLWQNPIIRYFAFVNGFLNFITASSFLVVILRTRELLPDSQLPQLPLITGLIFGSSSVGGIIGSVLAGRVSRRLPFPVVTLVSLWMWTILWLAQAVAPNYIVLAALNAGVMVLLPMYNGVVAGYRLSLIPDELLGRVNSAVRLISYSLQPLGALVAGILLQYNSAVTAIIVYGGVFVAIALSASFNRSVRLAR